MSYGEIADIYDSLMTTVDYDAWFSHYMTLFSMGNPVHHILELGCGTGNMTFRFARHCDVTGVDLSERMIEEARKKWKTAKLEHSVNFIQGDMRSFVSDQKYDAAVAVFDVMNYAVSREELASVCRRVSSVLRPGGRFIFDVNTELAFRLRLFDEEEIRPENDYVHIWRGYYDEETRLERIEMEFCVGGHTFRETQVQRAHTEKELAEALKEAGFERVYFFDCATMTTPTEHTDRLFVTACKKV